MLIYYDTDTQSVNFQGNPLCEATKQHLNNNLWGNPHCQTTK